MTKILKIDLNIVKRTFKEMNNDKGILGHQLIDELIFMKKTLKKLKKEINSSTVITKMCQGNYDIERANPAISQYNTMVKNYNSTIKQIIEILPSENLNPGDDGFDDF